MANIYLDESIDFDLVEVLDWDKVQLNTLMQVKMKKWGEYWWVLLKTNSTNPDAPTYIGVSAGSDRTDMFDIAQGIDQIIDCLIKERPKVNKVILKTDKNKWDLQKHIDKILKKIKE